MKATVRWAGEASFVGKTESGHSVLMDGAPEFGGQNRGARPMELLLLGMGGCTAFDVVLILRKARQNITDCVAQLSAERAPEDPKVFTRVHVHFVMTGRKLDPKRVEQALKLSAEKYCSASIMFAKTAEITHDLEIIELPKMPE